MQTTTVCHNYENKLHNLEAAAAAAKAAAEAAAEAAISWFSCCASIYVPVNMMLLISLCSSYHYALIVYL